VKINLKLTQETNYTSLFCESAFYNYIFGTKVWRLKGISTRRFWRRSAFSKAHLTLIRTITFERASISDLQIAALLRTAYVLADRPFPKVSSGSSFAKNFSYILCSCFFLLLPNAIVINHSLVFKCDRSPRIFLESAVPWNDALVKRIVSPAWNSRLRSHFAIVSIFLGLLTAAAKKSRMARPVNYGRSEGAWEHH